MNFDIALLNDGDGPDVLAIYAEGIVSRQSTFEMSVPSWEQWKASHLFECCFAARAENALMGWAALNLISARKCYAGVAEVSVYARGEFQSRGIGSALLQTAIVESEARGFWTLQASTFPQNAASLKMQARCGFRVIGRRERIAQLDGVWRDTVLTERRSQHIGAS
jgi:L-amino acid N-acyltransferase YncA